MGEKSLPFSEDFNLDDLNKEMKRMTKGLAIKKADSVLSCDKQKILNDPLPFVQPRRHQS